MKRQSFLTVAMAGVFIAVAVSGYAMDAEYVKKAADTNPFYVGEGRSAAVSYAGGEAPHIEKPWDKGAVGYHPHREGLSVTVSYAGGEAPHIEKPWDKGAVGHHRHK
ncbi:MAG: hypothetical protein AB1451_10020 [Nitrospirota bacterium]